MSPNFTALMKLARTSTSGNSHDAESARKLVRSHAKRGLEHLPSARVEHLEEAAIEDDPRGIALTPLDCELVAISEGRHADCPTYMMVTRYSGRQLRCHARHLPPP